MDNKEFTGGQVGIVRPGLLQGTASDDTTRDQDPPRNGEELTWRQLKESHYFTHRPGNWQLRPQENIAAYVTTLVP